MAVARSCWVMPYSLNCGTSDVVVGSAGGAGTAAEVDFVVSFGAPPILEEESIIAFSPLEIETLERYQTPALVGDG